MKIVAVVNSPVKQRKFGDRIVFTQVAYALPDYPNQHPSVPVQIELREGQAPLSGMALLSYKVLSGPYDSLKLPEKYALICAYQLSQAQVDFLTNVLGEVQVFVESGVSAVAPTSSNADLDEIKQQVANNTMMFNALMARLNSGEPSAAAPAPAAAAPAPSKPDANPVPASPYQAALDAQSSSGKK